MLPIEISEKQYDGVYREITGVDIRKTDVFNKAFYADVQDEREETFVVYTDHLDIRVDEDYIIYGYDSKSKYPFGVYEKVNFVHVVDVINGEIYTQNSRAGCVKGKVIGKSRYKFNFDIKEVQGKKNTYINLMMDIGYDFDSLQMENIAVGTYNIKLLENIFRFRNLYYDKYSEKEFLTFKETAVRNIKITNVYRQQLEIGLKKCTSFEEMGNYIRKNIDKFRDSSDLLYNRNDNMNNQYPVNLLGRNVSLNLYDGYSFNSALPFYFQFNNYKKSTQILAEIFFRNIEENESKKMIKYFRWKGCKEIDETEIGMISSREYGLYFPLLMLFRQSIELSFKLIFVNEILKKQTFTAKEKLWEYAKKIDGHDLICLLKEIRNILDNEVYDFLLRLSSFIYYNEKTDASFSRYLVNHNLEFYNLNKITIYYCDLENYISEFYTIMDYVFSTINFGFDINAVYSK